VNGNGVNGSSLNGNDGHIGGKAGMSGNGNGASEPSINGGPKASANGTNGHEAKNGHKRERPARAAAPLHSDVRAGLSGRYVPARFAHIVGWGMEVPRTIIKNEDLEAIVDTSDEWIRTRTGIHERRFASDRETVTSLGFEAARKALERADMLSIDIDLIVVATSTPENFYPSTASRIQNLLGAAKAGAFDLSAACSGFVYALNMAAQAIRSGSINAALVIGTETNSRVLDWTDRSTCILFGDGAGAVVLRGSDEPGGVLSCVLGSDGSGADLLGIPTVGQMNLPEGRQPHKLHMDGREVFRFATHIVNESIREAVAKAGLELPDIALIVPHQANQRILSAAARSLNVPESLFFSNIHKYGNTSAASIPIALCEAEKEGRMKPDDHIVIIGFGGGLTWGTMVIQWQAIKHPRSEGVAFAMMQARREAQYVYAVYRDLFMRTYRRVEARVRGPATALNPRRRKRTQQTEKDES
jgi:3-oxoacyl-[acyl-carrier-protein] synthase-3